MLILPIENKPDWKNPPVITIALILVNLFVFVFYQGQDGERIERAEELYRQHNLLELDRQYYLDYLEVADPERHRQLQYLGNQMPDWMLAQEIFVDRGFDAWLREQDARGALPSTPEIRQWRQGRDEFEAQRNSVSWIQGGLTPADSRPTTFFTNLFLHGGWDHLLFNMAFLFLFGFALESVLRTHIYLGMYLASGVVANVLHLALNLGSYIPLVGASGAIAGLMGMYLALYRLRRIRFFYTIGFYFGEFRAPALLVLPVWLAKELYGVFFTETNIAYWAHIGGLLSGAGLMLLAQNSQREFSGQLEQRDRVDQVEQARKRIQTAVAALDIPRARTLARNLCETHPADPRPWRLLFDLYKAQPMHKRFHEVTFALLRQFTGNDSLFEEWRMPVEAVLNEYRQLHPGMPALNGPLSLALARKYWQHGDPERSEIHLQRALDKGINNPAAQQLIENMAEHFRKRGAQHKATQYTNALRQLRSPG